MKDICIFSNKYELKLNTVLVWFGHKNPFNKLLFLLQYFTFHFVLILSKNLQLSSKNALKIFKLIQ